MNPLKVAITGCGVVASNGIGREAFAAAIREGRSGIGEIVSFDASDTGRERAAEIHGFSPDAWLRSPKNYLDRNSALAFAACEMAVRESGAVLPDMGRGYGIAVGTMSGNMESLGAFHSRVKEKGPKLAPPFLFPHTYYNTTLGLLSIEYGLNGPHNQFCSGGAAGLEAVAWAAECIALGRAPLMIAGGVEAFSEPLFRSALARGWLSPLDGCEESCKPFAPDRNGTILGEGAAFFVLEPAESAKKPLALIESIGVATTPEASIRTAMDGAFIEPGQVVAVFAAAGGYPEEDGMEEAAIRRVLEGRDAEAVALKGLLGETLGASGPLALVCALSGGIEVGKGRRRFLVNAGGPARGEWVSTVITVS
jgi:3-oxoacyl-(acyl-carrier-protein) synthase